MSVNYYNDLQALYLGLFDRPADAGGETYWNSQMQTNMTGALDNISSFAQYYSGNNGLNGVAISSSNIANEIVNIYANLFGYTPSTTDAGVQYWATQWTNGTSIGQILDSIYNVVAAYPSTSPYIDQQTTMNSRISAATSYTQANANATYSNSSYLAEGQSILTGASTSTSTYILTSGADVATATDFIASLTPYTQNGVGPTLNYDDVLTGTSGGTANTLTINDDYSGATDIMPLGTKISNIQNVVLQTNGNAGSFGTPFSTANNANISGVTDLAVTSGGGGNNDYVQAASTTNISVTHDSTSDGVYVLGGDAVTVTENSNGEVQTGTLVLGSVPTSANIAAGAIGVTVNGSGPGGINIMGGSSVTVDVTNAANTQTIDVGNTVANTGDSVNGGLANTTGAISITDAGNGAITSYGGSTVNVSAAGGPVTVGEFTKTPTVASNNPSGAVTVNDTQAKTFNNTTNAIRGGGIAVTGGTDISVTTNTGSGVAVGDQSAASDPTGSVSVTDTSTNAAGLYNLGAGAYQATIIYGGTGVTVNEAGGSVTVGGTAATNPSGAVSVTETAVSQQLVTIDGGNGVTVNAQAQTVDVGTNTGTAGAQIVNQSAVLTGNGLGGGAGTVTVMGGTSVTVNTTGGVVTVGGKLPSGAAAVPSGAVNIADTFSGANSANTDSFLVQGGGAVSITTTPTGGAISIGLAPVLNAAGTALANSAYDPTGNITIDNSETNNGTVTYGTSATNIYTDGAASVSVTGGDGGNIFDVNQFLATGGPNAGTPVGTSALASVSLDGVAGAVVIQSDAFNTLTIADSLKAAAATTVTNGGTGGYDSEGAHTLSLTLNNDTNAATSVTDGTATAVTVATSGATADNIKIVAAKATSLTFNNTAAVILAAADQVSGAGADTIKATGSGALNLGDTTGWTGAGHISSINASSATGAVTATIDGNVTAFTGGSGNDVITVTTGAAQTINGGSGSDNTVILNNTAATYNSLLNPNGPVSGDFTNFQYLGLMDNAGAGASGIYDVSGFTGVNLLTNTSAALTLNNAASGETLAIQGAQTNTVTWSPAAGATTLPITVGIDGPKGTGTAGIAAGTVDTTVVNTYNIDSVGTGASGTQNTLTLNDVTNAGNGNTVTAITVAGDEKLTLTSNVADASSAINSITVTSSAAADVSMVGLAAKGATITGGAGMLTASTDTVNTAGTSVDKVVSGAGGVTDTLGAGGAGGLKVGDAPGGAATGNTGSETVNLSAATAASTVIAPTTPIAGYGSRGIINGFNITDSASTSDILAFGAGKTVVANTNSVTITAAGGSGNKYSVSNGMYTPLQAVAAAQELLDVQQLVSGDAALAGPGVGGANYIGAVTINGTTYVIASDTSTGFNAITPADQNLETIFQLSGDSGLSGFGSAQVNANVATAADNTILVGSALTLQNANNGGSAAANTAYNDSGYALDTLSNSAAGITNTFNNLAPWAQLNITGAVAAGNVVTTQTGTAGTDTLVIHANGAFTLDSFTVNGDNALVLDASAASETIKSLTDATNTVTTISITGGNAVTVNAITDTALTKIDASHSTGALSLGATSALSQAGLTILGGTGALTVAASGAGDTLTVLNGGSTITANGAGDTITAGNGANTITANGAGDNIKIWSVANGDNAAVQTIHASGAGDTITFSATLADGTTAMHFTAASTVDGGAGIGIGADDTVTFGNNVGGSQTVVLTGDLTGAIASGNYDYTTLSNVVHASGDLITFNNDGAVGVATEQLLGQANVAGASSLASALNTAASEAAASYGWVAPNNDYIPAHTGVIDWFQYAGNTYIVEANNATGSAAPHAALGTGDEVVKIVGLVDLSAAALSNNNAVGNHTLTL